MFIYMYMYIYMCILCTYIFIYIFAFVCVWVCVIRHNICNDLRYMSNTTFVRNEHHICCAVLSALPAMCCSVVQCIL